jgi:DNA topoisomerase-1
MNLVVVESPAKAKTINKYLGRDYKVVASYGHIRDLPSKKGSVDTENNFKMYYETDSYSKKHINELVKEAKNCENIYLATDPDREGEAISWHVVEVLKEKNALKHVGNIYRIAFNEITKNSVQQAIKSPREIDSHLVNSQQARRALDYLVGFSLSPILWRKLPGSRSAGRVQSVALRLICEREYEIENFTSQEYWDIKLNLKNSEDKPFTAKLTHIDGKKLDKFDISNEQQAAKIKDELSSRNYKVSKVELKQQNRNPAPAFTTSTMQQEAARKLGFGAKKTMQIAQKLYEGIDVGGETQGLITYMRTDGVYVAREAVTEARSEIEKQFGSQYVPKQPREFKSKAKNAQEAHEAIRPTNINYSPKKLHSYLDKDSLRLYELIWKRMMASQMQSAVLDVISADIYSTDDRYISRASGSKINFPGFYALYREGGDDDNKEEEDSNYLPKLNEGEELQLDKVDAGQHFTEPPPRYTEASLVKKLEELGIGRPSTYATILSVIQDRKYVKLEKKRFVPEPRGRIVTTFLVDFFTKYFEYGFTAKLEEELDQIASGELDYLSFLNEFWGNFTEKVKEAENISVTEVIDNLNEKLAKYLFPANDNSRQDPRKCPECENGRLSLKLGKFGGFIACSNYPECKYNRQIGGGEAGSEQQEQSSSGDKNQAAPKEQFLGELEGSNIYYKFGPYGPYIQKGENSTSKSSKPKRVPIPNRLKDREVDINLASKLLSMPKNLGAHPETGQQLVMSVGKFGPYVKHGNKFASIPASVDFLDISYDKALELINNKK